MKTELELWNKTFLSNRPDEDSNITWRVDVSTMGEGDDKTHWLDADFTVADCHRRVDLCFDIREHWSATINDRLSKVDAMIKELEQFKDALIQCHNKKLELEDV